MCLYPKLIKNRKYISNKKNKGNIPPITDERVRYVPVGCGNCIECRKQKAREWQVRLQEEIKERKNGKFITLTFSDESIKKLYEQIKEKAKNNKREIPSGYNLDNELAILALRLFNERYRKTYKKAIRHWLVTELGHKNTENIHMHGIVWTDIDINTIRKIWNYGYIYPRTKDEIKINYVNAKTINYIVKYVHKIDHDHLYYKSIILTSPGIGKRYIKTQDATKNKYKTEKTNETYRTSIGTKIALPIYYRNHIYNEEEKEKLWLQRLDKEERYVLGTKVNISKDENEYKRALIQARKLNKELGYKTDEKNYEQEQYERDKRILLQKTRLAKAHKKQVSSLQGSEKTK